jgi:CRISPR/Cas system-associated endonuclease Cas3-HD
LSKNDLVVSLIPYTYHATVIKAAIRTKKNVVTTSYVSPAMMELEKEAKEAGITVMNEIGLDPVRCVYSNVKPLPMSFTTKLACYFLSRASTISTLLRPSPRFVLLAFSRILLPLLGSD